MWISRDEPRSRAEAEAEVKDYEDQLAEAGIPSYSSPEHREAQVQRHMRESAWAQYARALDGSASPEVAQIHRMLDANRDLGRIGLRYVGGLANHPAQADVAVRVMDDHLVLLDSTGRSAFWRVQLSHLLVAAIFESESAAGPWFGLGVGALIVFQEPKVRSGGWVLTYADGAGGFGQLALAARSGLFSRKPTREFFGLVNAKMKHAASQAIVGEEVVAGPYAYARRLGLLPPNIESHPVTTPHSAPPNVLRRFDQLEDLRRRRLISAEEFERKRSQLLDEL